MDSSIDATHSHRLDPGHQSLLRPVDPLASSITGSLRALALKSLLIDNGREKEQESPKAFDGLNVYRKPYAKAAQTQFFSNSFSAFSRFFFHFSIYLFLYPPFRPPSKVPSFSMFLT